MQVLGRDRAILRWLAQRGGARHHRMWQARGARMPVAIAIGADPATVLSATLPLPETVSEIGVAGLLRDERPALARCVSIPLHAPAEGEIASAPSRLGRGVADTQGAQSGVAPADQEPKARP